MAVFYDKDTDPDLILKRRVAVLGYGAQGRAHALNLRDSGVDVVVGLRSGSASAARCRADGIATQALDEAVGNADFVMMLVPDETHAQVYAAVLGPCLATGATLAFAHGFSIHYRLIDPRDDLDVVMVAPMGIGDQVRSMYEKDSGVPALLCICQDASGHAAAIGLSYAWALGHGRTGIIESTFREETETDLFAEQVVLCGGVTHLVEAAFDTLVDAGYPDELAYFGCLHELKLITDLMYERGIAGMRKSISSTAEYGDYESGPRIIDEHCREKMRGVLSDIRSGAFASRLADEFAAGGPTLAAGRARAQAHPIESVGARLRAMMPWLRRAGG